MRISLTSHPGQIIYLICLPSVRLHRPHENIETDAFDENMEALPEIIRDFGQVFCGEKAIECVKIRNTSKKAQIITVVPVKGGKIIYGRLRISPQKAVAPPGKAVRFTLTYSSNLENLTDIISYDIFECEKLVARLNVKARTLGPFLSSKTYNLKFFRFRNVNRTVKTVTLENLNNCEAKFHFDIDEDYERIRISQACGVIPADSKLSLKIFFNPSEPGIYYKTIVCLLQYHPPLIFNVLSMSQPKITVEPKSLNLRRPLEMRPDCNYAAYMRKLKTGNAGEGEKIAFLRKCAAERDCLSGPTNAEMEEEICLSGEESDLYQLNKSKINKNPIEAFLTAYFINIKNRPETLMGTTLVNPSKCQCYYYEWDRDSNDNFRICPERGVIEPNMKTYFNIYFSPSDLDLLYHTELDLRVFPYENDSDVVDLPLTLSLRIVVAVGWPNVPWYQKPFSYVLVSPRKTFTGLFSSNDVDIFRSRLLWSHRKQRKFILTVLRNYSVQPPLGYLSRDFQLFVIEFNGKEEGIYCEDLKITFNNTESIYEILKVATSVETPQLIFGNDNSHTFKPIFPGAQTSETILIKNPTNLYLSYEFKTPEDVTWCEVINPKGVIEPNCFSEVTVTFKPELPCEHADSIPCWVSSISKMDYVKIVLLHLSGSCQYGYLVATPSVYDYGECPYLEQKSTKIHLFNFSPVLIHFQLMTVHRAFPVGDNKKDVIITPDRGTVPAKCSLEVEVGIIPHGRDIFQYAILCQNLESDSEDARTCDEPRTVFSFRFEGVVPSIQIIDLNLKGAGRLFSPHWLWKMININRINRGFNSLKREFVVDLKFPEALFQSPPISIMVLFEANRHGDYHCAIHKRIVCPCLQASEGHISGNCIHSTLVTLTPNTLTVGASKRVLMQLYISYEEIRLCSTEWVLELPHRRKLILRANMVSLSPDSQLSIASMYLIPIFYLKPVFIGDINPPLQLFWLYNNTFRPAVYSVVDVTLWEDPSNAQRIIECINPDGEIPPFSSLPLGFIFRPNELKKYTGKITVSLQESKIECITLEGEGIPNVVQINELGFEKTVPMVSSFYPSKVDLYCSVNHINIDFLRTFSKIKRIFFVRNRSSTQTWSFRWHTFKIDNVIFARIEPSEGRVEPGQKSLMTLSFESFSYPTSVSFSIPCDIVDYSALKAYEEAIRLQKTLTENAKDYFTITEKGITYENPAVKIPEKPHLYHIFISVNANVFSNVNVEIKLKSEQQLRLKAENEMERRSEGDVFLKTAVLPHILPIFEKSLWNIINNSNFWRKMECSKNTNDCKYLQFLPEGNRNRKQDSNPTPLQRSYIQSILERKLEEIFSSALICTTAERVPTLVFVRPSLEMSYLKTNFDFHWKPVPRKNNKWIILELTNPTNTKKCTK